MTAAPRAVVTANSARWELPSQLSSNGINDLSPAPRAGTGNLETLADFASTPRAISRLPSGSGGGAGRIEDSFVVLLVQRNDVVRAVFAPCIRPRRLPHHAAAVGD